MFTLLNSLQNNGKTKVVPAHVKEIYGGVEVWLHSFLGTRWRCAISYMPWQLYTKERAPGTN